jgi:hypothetical protein
MKNINSKQKIRGVSLLSAVFGELSQQLPEGVIGSEELLSVAQKLIDLSKREYVTNFHPDGQHHQGYYSYDLCTAFKKFQNQIFETETVAMEDRVAECGWRNSLKELLLGSHGDMVLEEFYG